MSIEESVLSGLIYDEDYTRRVIPFLKKEYFHSISDQKVYTLIDEYVQKYNNLPSKEALLIELENSSGLNEEHFKESKSKILSLVKPNKNDLNWLLDQTEKFCQDKAIYNSIRDSIKLLDDPVGSARGSIPQLLSDALSVSFDSNIGHSYTEDAENRFDFYHKTEERIPFDIDFLNLITKGGLPKKSLTILMGGIGCVHPDTKIKIRRKKK